MNFLRSIFLGEKNMITNMYHRINNVKMRMMIFIVPFIGQAIVYANEDKLKDKLDAVSQGYGELAKSFITNYICPIVGIAIVIRSGYQYFTAEREGQGIMSTIKIMLLGIMIAGGPYIMFEHVLKGTTGAA